jgi:hypothetical protein
MKIAKYFGIPLTDFIEKDLSVNELLHYNTNFVIETEKLKLARRLANIHYVSTPYINDYIQNYNDAGFIQKLPVITVPCSSKSELIAIEIQDINDLPAGFNFRNGDILIFEKITKENIHHATGKLGMITGTDSLKYGVYKTEGDFKSLSLNELVKYPFDINSGQVYWLLQATYKQE